MDGRMSDGRNGRTLLLFSSSSTPISTPFTAGGRRGETRYSSISSSSSSPVSFPLHEEGGRDIKAMHIRGTVFFSPL